MENHPARSCSLSQQTSLTECCLHCRENRIRWFIRAKRRHGHEFDKQRRIITPTRSTMRRGLLRHPKTESVVKRCAASKGLTVCCLLSEWNANGNSISWLTYSGTCETEKLQGQAKWAERACNEPNANQRIDLGPSRCTATLFVSHWCIRSPLAPVAAQAALHHCDGSQRRPGNIWKHVSKSFKNFKNRL